MEDEQLLKRYCESRSQEAFRELVERHIGMVYSAAHRMVGDAQLAEEIAQGAFAMLAQKGASVRRPQVVGGWLYSTTRNLALHAVRSEQRRRERERVAVAMQTLNSEASADDVVEQLEPAMAELDEADRGALVLRFLEDRNLREVGAELGITEDAARMRVNRALERLREVFARRGTAVTSATLMGILATATAKAVPSGLAAAIVAGSSAASLTTMTIMSWINAKSVAAMATAAILAGTGSYMVQKQKSGQVQAQADAALAQLDEAKTAAQAAQQALAARERDLQNLRSTALELAQARNQITQLLQQQQRDAAARTATPVQPPPVVRAAAPAAFPPGAYINREQLSFAGFATPEAAVQTLAWAAVHGDTDFVAQAVATTAPQAAQLAAQLQQALLRAGPAFKGTQVMAEKSIADDRVEILVKVDVQAPPGTNPNALPPPYNILTMVRENNEWKMGGTPQDYSPDWQKTGQIKTFAQ